MTDLAIKVDRLRLVYPIYSVRAQSLRNTVLNLAVGGRLMKDSHQIVQVQALQDVSFVLRDGERLGVMGHNGSGKTTLLKVLAGIYEPTSGQLIVNGRISSMLDIGHGLDQDATGAENLVNMGRLRGLSRRQVRDLIPSIVEFSELGAFIDLPVKTYSAGMSMRLIFALATSLEPDILILDEWLGAGDTHFVDKAAARMSSMVGRSRSVVLASHSFELIQRVCDKLLVLEAGRVVYFGPAEAYQPKAA